MQLILYSSVMTSCLPLIRTAHTLHSPRYQTLRGVAVHSNAVPTPFNSSQTPYVRYVRYSFATFPSTFPTRMEAYLQYRCRIILCYVVAVLPRSHTFLNGKSHAHSRIVAIPKWHSSRRPNQGHPPYLGRVTWNRSSIWLPCRTKWRSAAVLLWGVP